MTSRRVGADYSLEGKMAEPYSISTSDLRPLKRFLQILLVSLGCLHLAGGPYLLVQGIAWTGMLVRYTQQDGLVKGAFDTFSGEKPCALCCKITDAKRDESRRTPALPAATMKSHEMIPITVVSLVPPRFSKPPAIGFAGKMTPPDRGAAAPPTPPPRAMA